MDCAKAILHEANTVPGITYLVVCRREKRRLGPFNPKEARVTYLVLQTHRKLPLLTTNTISLFESIQSGVKVPPFLGPQDARGLERRRRPTRRRE